MKGRLELLISEPIFPAPNGRVRLPAQVDLLPATATAPGARASPLPAVAAVTHCTYTALLPPPSLTNGHYPRLVGWRVGALAGGYRLHGCTDQSETR